MCVLPLAGRRIRTTYASPSRRYASLFLSPDGVSVRTGINVRDAFISLRPTHPVRPSLSSPQILAVPAFPSSFILAFTFSLSLFFMHIVAGCTWPWGGPYSRFTTICTVYSRKLELFGRFTKVCAVYYSALKYIFIWECLAIFFIHGVRAAQRLCCARV